MGLSAAAVATHNPSPRSVRRQIVEHNCRLCGSAKKASRSSATDGSDILDGQQVGARFLIRWPPMRPARTASELVMAGDALRGRLADLADAERVDRKRSRPTVRRRASMARNRLRTDSSPQPSRVARARRHPADGKRKMSAGARFQQALLGRSRWMILSPRPSISKARREQKWMRRSTACAGQIRPPVQRRATSPSSRIGGGFTDRAMRSGKFILRGISRRACRSAPRPLAG